MQKTRQEKTVVELLHELNGQGQTIVLVTHEPDVAEHANRQIVLLDGKVQHEPLAA